MIERLPGARLAELPDAGHDVHVDQPGAWTRTLGDFLEEVA